LQGWWCAAKCDAAVQRRGQNRPGIRFKGFILFTVFGLCEMSEMNRLASPAELTNAFAAMGYVDADRRKIVA
jgi:hypothetical protein